MTTTAAINTFSISATSKTTIQANEKTGFTDMLDSSQAFFQLSMNLVDALLRSRGSSPSAPASSGFTSEFEAVFGSTGPLPDFINRVTASLKLSPEQNLALQNIAVRNKDITKTPENVQKIAAELKAAGIGY